MKNKKLLFSLLVILFSSTGCKGETNNEKSEQEKPNSVTVLSNRLPIADPYILLHDNVYYSYGTAVGNGFDVYSSNDLEHWVRASSLSLSHTNSYGEKFFWAPEVYYVEKEKKFYMFYSAEEHICVATSDSPLGPFIQDEKKPIREEKSIDTSVFFDDNGKAYLYFVRFNDGNVIWCAELKDNLKEIKEETLTECFRAEEPWELILPKVVEGPSIFKQDGVYYMLYSANGYTSQDYAVGFATSDSPYGPWVKYEGNPVLHKYAELEGVGHGAPFYDKDGKMHYIFHAHNSSTEVQPRTSFIVDMSINDGIISLGNNLIRPMVVDKLPDNK
ncbi:glycoside hydrolase family 43 protein [Massilibacteroides sp.]|uniref:glycoside hydrolase family 43 protein n=1 Tax=Massilibacteroides sp. TaxID=2034766 RepID=UPI002606FED3|nr:glycoside hydrolase family 43 protein [Massilibacteroides sp.]MDD4514091.1 glycoside hydrolase family 43 protein [Massilibacteroides sp.]